jgi:hypothetical protein
MKKISNSPKGGLTAIAVSLLTALAVCASCTTNKPAPKRGIPDTYTLAYEEIYGHCYDSIPYGVVALDLYSDGIELDKNHRIQGSGYNLYLSDIFVPDSLLEEGTYTSIRKDSLYSPTYPVSPHTFLPGMDFEGYPHGMYLLNIEEAKVIQIQLVDSGAFTYRNDSLLFTLFFRNTYGSKVKYTCSFHGSLIPWPKKSKIRI